ncbi:MAG: hypothetical protein ACWGQW_14795, partial [bacterium]
MAVDHDVPFSGDWKGTGCWGCPKRLISGYVGSVISPRGGRQVRNPGRDNMNLLTLMRRCRFACKLTVSYDHLTFITVR